MAFASHVPMLRSHALLDGMQEALEAVQPAPLSQAYIWTLVMARLLNFLPVGEQGFRHVAVSFAAGVSVLPQVCSETRLAESVMSLNVVYRWSLLARCNAWRFNGCC